VSRGVEEEAGKVISTNRDELLHRGMNKRLAIWTGMPRPDLADKQPGLFFDKSDNSVHHRVLLVER
jgi:hypothetical protein